MEIDTSNLTDEQISKLNEFVHTMEKENKATKWWIMPKYTPFLGMADFEKYGPCYYVEPQKDSYSRNRPPLETGFNSEEEAVKWLSNYLREEDLFLKAIDELDNLRDNIGCIIQKLRNHQYISETEWDDCFMVANASIQGGPLKEVTK